MAEETKFTGTGYYEYPTGGEYKGEFVNGMQDGFGIMTFKNHDLYEGDWKEGKMDGYGEYYHYDEKKDRFVANYKGQFKHGVREGVGRMEYANRNIYEGQWQNNMRTGNGACWLTNGDCFHGLWRFDEMLRGVFYKANGDRYDGEFKNGKPLNGIILFPEERGKISEYKDGVQQ